MTNLLHIILQITAIILGVILGVGVLGIVLIVGNLIALALPILVLLSFAQHALFKRNKRKEIK